VAEWSNAAVLKTVEAKASGGSNPSPSAKFRLIENGINKNRMKFKGDGEINPIATNETEEGQQLNRRIEFKILSEDS
jgi:hypothetical protein